MNLDLHRLKWLVAILVISFLLVFEYLRHFVWPGLLHTMPAYLASLAVILAILLLFNQNVFRVLGKMQANLVQQTNYLNTLIENSGHAIITTDLQGKILSWNRGAEAIYGWTKEEAIGQVLLMVPPHLRDESRELIDILLRQREPLYNFETQRLRKTGELIPVMVTVSPMMDANGKVVRFLGISTDMRERKRLEQEVLRQQRALAVLQERERLARELHDSLGQILGYVNTQSQAVRELLAKNQTKMADTYLKRLVEVAQDAHADVREYILSLQTQPSREQKFIPALREYLQRFGQNSGVRTELIVPNQMDQLEFDPTVEAQLMRIVQEALTNVRKHARAQHVRVDFQLKDGLAQIQVADDGKGFDPTQPAEEGRHFGQRIMRERAEEIGGSVTVQSLAGAGTQVIVQAPLHKGGSDEGVAGR